MSRCDSCFGLKRNGDAAQRRENVDACAQNWRRGSSRRDGTARQSPNPFASVYGSLVVVFLLLPIVIAVLTAFDPGGVSRKRSSREVSAGDAADVF